MTGSCTIYSNKGISRVGVRIRGNCHRTLRCPSALRGHRSSSWMLLLQALLASIEWLSCLGVFGSLVAGLLDLFVGLVFVLQLLCFACFGWYTNSRLLTGCLSSSFRILARFCPLFQVLCRRFPLRRTMFLAFFFCSSFLTVRLKLSRLPFLPVLLSLSFSLLVRLGLLMVRFFSKKLVPFSNRPIKCLY